jgi:hypothetical protein
MKIRRQGPRQQSTIARAERDGVVVCPDVLVVVHSGPAGLGTKPHDDLTAWFYGTLERRFEEDLEDLAASARAQQPAPGETTVDLILRVPGGELRLERCRLGLPIRYAGPASTLEFRVAHPGVVQPSQLKLVA